MFNAVFSDAKQPQPEEVLIGHFPGCPDSLVVVQNMNTPLGRPQGLETDVRLDVFARMTRISICAIFTL
jgi:hypothetical protein